VQILTPHPTAFVLRTLVNVNLNSAVTFNFAICAVHTPYVLVIKKAWLTVKLTASHALRFDKL